LKIFAKTAQVEQTGQMLQRVKRLSDAIVPPAAAPGGNDGHGSADVEHVASGYDV